MTWNLKFGGGRIDFFFDCHGNRVLMDSAEVFHNMEGIAKLINQLSPDILFVQEIDLDSRRSAYINQVQWLLDHTTLNHAVYAPQWRAGHIPSHGLGRMNSGNAILSRSPLKMARRIALPLIGDQNRIVRYFYLRRHLLHAQTTIHGETIQLLNTHLSAYAKDGTKKKQIDQIDGYLDSLTQKNRPFILAGDFNTLPPYTKQTSRFADSACTEGDFEADDYSHETHWLSAVYDHYFPAIPLEQYRKDNSPYFTHTTDKDGFWNRKLDYIFSNRPFVEDSGTTWQSITIGGFETMGLSDHCPVGVRWRLPSPPVSTLIKESGK
jgi:endonuclease/exonuclease/phosphatase family metal-dependent hydrolase